MICYAFAVPHESRELVSLLKEKESFELHSMQCIVGKYKHRTILVATIGMGLGVSAKNAEVLLQYFRFKAMIMAGYGGALVPQLKRNEVVIAQNFSSEELLSFVRLLPHFQFCNFCSTDEIVAEPARKAAFAQATQCQVVDMETAAVADVVRSREKPFLAIRVISDEASDELPVAAFKAGFDAVANRETPLKLCWYLLMRPMQINSFRQTVSRLVEARKSLTKFLVQLTDELPSSW